MGSRTPPGRAPHSRGELLLLLTHILVLAIVQGITEFLPISSSGHLVLTSRVLGWPDQGILIDIAVHAGTLLAVVVYFWRDLWEMTLGTIGIFTGRRAPALHLVACLIIATIPVVIVGYFGLHYIEEVLRSVELIAWTTLGFRHSAVDCRPALHDGAAARAYELCRGPARRPRPGSLAAAGHEPLRHHHDRLPLSRLGTARGRALLDAAVDPDDSGAASLAGLEIYKAGDAALRLDAVVAAGLAFVTALFAIALMMRWLSTRPSRPS